MKLTVKEIIEACGGKLLCGNPETEVTCVCTDSRKVRPGALFVPIKGERTDAHTYIPATFAAGATAAFTEEHHVMEDSHVWIYVPSTLTALQLLATAYRKRFTFPVVGITGSVGKTTTKEMVALALSAQRSVMKTEGNFNSQIGLPLTIFRLEENQNTAVIEMGMSDFGEMGRLAEIAAPDFAVMTNIGISHIQQLKTQENILKEKLNIINGFHKGSVLFLNGDDARLAALKETLSVTIVYFGTQPWCDYCAEDIAFDADGTRFTCVHGKERIPVKLAVPGLHNVTNALAGLAVAEVLGVDVHRAAQKLEEYRPLSMRQQIHRTPAGFTIVDDTYNASPDSVNSSVDVLCSLRQKGGRCVAVLADMLELGEMEHRAHFDVGAYAAKAGIDFLVTVGERAKAIAEGARSVRAEIPCKECSSNAEAVQSLKEWLKSGDAMLVKGSRGMLTDQIVKEFL